MRWSDSTVVTRIVTAGWDDTVSIMNSDGQVLEQSIVLDAKANAMATGSQLTVIVTVGGLILNSIQNRVAVSPSNVLSYNAESMYVSRLTTRPST